ncbi:unnamed protein product [Ilex paraguariensis]|uniref:Protein TIFY n=1 Tax=Ilex paraguariensis TaxID=185542 RepID=A0ABC8TEL2_9AQUA
MGRNCNLDLRLVPTSVSSVSLQSTDFEDQHHHQEPIMDLMGASTNEKHQQQLTIFYDGRVSVCDVTELQARAIILLASREMEEKSKTLSGSSDPPSPLLQSQLSSPTGLPLKRSLQRFLQKRKHRIQATSPYNH